MNIGDRVQINILGMEHLWSSWAIRAFHYKRGTIEERRPDDWLVVFDEPVPNPNGGPAIRSHGFDASELVVIGPTA